METKLRSILIFCLLICGILFGNKAFTQTASGKDGQEQISTNNSAKSRGGSKGDKGGGKEKGDQKGDHKGGGKDNNGNGGSGKGDCDGICFGTEVLSAVVNDSGCVEYELKISHSDDCRYELSHFSVEVPCGTVSEISNSRGWKIEVGTDPTTGLEGFKIDDIQNFGKGEDNSFIVKVTVCGDDDCMKRIGQVAYKAGQCVDYETPDYEIEVPNDGGGDTGGGDTGGGDSGGGNTGGGDTGGGDSGGGDTGGGDTGSGDTGGGDTGGGGGEVTCSTLVATITKNDVSCFNAADGQLSVDVAAGAEPIEFYWSNGSTNSSLSGLAPGTYSVTVVDADGNTVTLSENIVSPSDLLISKNTVRPTCAGLANGSIDLTVSGGTGPYIYSWNNGSTSEDLANLPASLLTVTVTDANGCTKTNSTFLQNTVSITTSGTLAKPSNCSEANGAINVSVNGGTAPYTFLWSNGSTTEDLVDVPADSYSLTITDANGCQGFGNYTLIQINTLQTTYSVAPTACIDDNSGSIDLTVSGGTAPYSFSWQHGATSEDISGLKAGIYRVTVTDASGCSLQTAINVPKKTIQVVDAITQPLCFGDATGSITLTPSGGIDPYTYNWSTGGTSSSIDGLEGGTYTVTITDASGCSRTLQYTITQPQALSAATSLMTNQCGAEGSFALDLTVSGGKTPYSYSWSNGQTTQDISGVNAGTYNVLITDANGCTTSQSVTIDASVYQTACSIVQPTSPVVCGSVGNSISSDVNGAQSYSWSVTSSDNSWSITSGASSANAIFSAGNPGSSATFTLTLAIDGCTKTCMYSIDANGCEVKDSNGGGDPSTGDPCDPNSSNAATSTAEEPSGERIAEPTETVESEVSAYPNPFDNDVNFEYTAPETEIVTLEVFDALGNKVQQVYAGQVIKGQTYTFECSNLGLKNMYIFKLTSGSKTYYGKLLKK